MRSRHCAGRIEAARPSGGRSSGMTMIEISLAICILSVIVLGLMGALSTGFLSQRTNTDIQGNQYHAREVMEELQSTTFSSLLSFNGTSLTSNDGKYRAAVAVTSVGTNLVRVTVTSNPVAAPTVQTRLITQIARLD